MNRVPSGIWRLHVLAIYADRRFDWRVSKLWADVNTG
jgi:hypothetical protein